MGWLKDFWGDRRKRNALLLGAGAFGLIWLLRSRGNGAPQIDRYTTGQLLAPVYFEFGQRAVPEGEDERLRALGAYITSVNRQLTITGHTDGIGTNQDNIALGQARANAVAGVVARGAGTIALIRKQTAGESACPTSGEDQSCRRVSFAVSS